MDVDTALALVGGLKRFHLVIFCALSLSSFIPMTFFSISIVFIGWTPPHHCSLGENQTKEEWIPRKEHGTWESCYMYTQANTPNETQPCTSWHYESEGYTTMVTEFDLVCDGNYLADMTQIMLMTAQVVADCVCSYFSDRFGRKKVHIAMLYLGSAFAMSVAFSLNYIWLLVSRILIGMITMVVINSGLTLMTELFDSTHRTFAGIGLEFGWVVVYFLPLPLAYFAHNWRVYMLIASFLPLCFCFYHCFLPESPAWHVSYSRFVEAEVILNKLARYNGVHVPPIRLSRTKGQDSKTLQLETQSQNGNIGKKLSHYIETDLAGKTAEPLLSPSQSSQENITAVATKQRPKSALSNGSTGDIANGVVVNNNLQPGPYSYSLKASPIPPRHLKPAVAQEVEAAREHAQLGSRGLARNSRIFSSTDSIAEAEKSKEKGYVPVTSLLRDPKLRNHLLLSNCFWFANACVYYGLILNAPNYGNRFITYFFMGLAEIPAYIVSLLVVDRCGRRPSMAVFYILTGLALSVTIFIPESASWGSTASICLVLFARFAISGSFAIMILYLRELFPTDVRSSSVAYTAIGGGIGSVAAPIIAYIGKVQPRLPNVVFGAISLLVALCVIPLPETTGKPLPLNLQELYSIYYPKESPKSRLHSSKETKKQNGHV